MTLFVNPRLEYLLHARPVCPECGDTKQQQIITSWSSPPQWGCRLCKFAYEYEPDGTPTLDEAEKAIARAFPALTRRKLRPLRIGTRGT